MEPDPNLTATAHELMPYTKLIGLEVLAASADEVRARLAWAEERCTSNGIMHGGALMSMADAVGAMVAVANLPEGASGTSTISSATNFLRAAARRVRPCRESAAAPRSHDDRGGHRAARRRGPAARTGDADPGGAELIAYRPSSTGGGAVAA